MNELFKVNFLIIFILKVENSSLVLEIERKLK